MPKTLITGVTGQDGSYLAEQLVAKGHNVYGMVRPSSANNLSNLDMVLNSDKFTVVHGDLCDELSLRHLIKTLKPDYLYNLGAQSHVGMSSKVPLLTNDINNGGTLRLLEAIRTESPLTRFYQASTSEMFGGGHVEPQCEKTNFHPRSPYGIAKLAAYWHTRHYRKAYGIHACNGILFNHESERRGLDFVTRKITRAVAAISLGMQKEVRLGNLDAHRDWGYAPDYMEAAQLILEHDTPDDWVVGSGTSHSVRHLVKIAFTYVGLDYMDHVIIDPQFYRPEEVECLISNPTKIKKELGWNPSTSFTKMIHRMIDNDIMQLNLVDLTKRHTT